MHLRGTALVIAGAAIACTPARRPPIYRVDQRYVIDLAPAELHAHPDAGRLLAAATTVAFLPPDDCRVELEIAVDAPPPPSVVCESAIARLETAALDAGLEVVSWRALTGEGPVIERAAAAGVDLLFEVGELGAGAAAHELYAAATTRVVTEPDGRAIAPRDPAAVAARCAAELAPVLAPELAVILDVQAVDVADGRVVWTYRRTHHPAAGAHEAVAGGRYTATVGLQPEGVSTAKIVVGSVALSIGIPTLLATAVVDGAGDVDPPREFYLGELALLGLGIYSLATMNADARWRYSPPDDVVCRADHATLAGELPEGAAPVDVHGCDGRCRRAMVQVDAAVDDLFAQIVRLRAAAAAP